MNADSIVLTDAARKYIDFKSNLLPDTVNSVEPLIYFLVAMIPCEKLWPWLGTKLDADQNILKVSPNVYYEAWIVPNLPTKPKGSIEVYVEAYFLSSYDSDKALGIYQDAMTLEKEFFESATPSSYGASETDDGA